MKRTPCSSRQALVLARWEKNRAACLDGGFFELRSKVRWLQETVGEGGTLWIVVSRPSGTGRLYTLSFCLRHCRKHTYRKAGKFGRFAVIGDPQRSNFFATADAKLLLLALRFDPEGPINGPSVKQVSNSIRVPRCLSQSASNCSKSTQLELTAGVFVSYQRRGEQKVAADLSDALQRAGVSVFRDQESLTC